jgi:hypothetical protein
MSMMEVLAIFLFFWKPWVEGFDTIRALRTPPTPDNPTKVEKWIKQKKEELNWAAIIVGGPDSAGAFPYLCR